MNRISAIAGKTGLSRPEAVIFDMDGVLFDTEALYAEAAAIAGEELGHTVPEAVLGGTIGLSWAGTRRLLRDALGPSFPVEDYIGLWLSRFDGLAATRLAMKPGVVELIGMLDRLGIRRAIATGSMLSSASRHLAAHSLTDRFHAVVTGEDCARGKPAPDPFLTAAERLGAAPERCLAIEDSHNGVRSAHAAGMTVIMVPDLVPPNEEMHGLCYRVAQDLHEVSELVWALAHP